jgi:hypothetical protein
MESSDEAPRKSRAKKTPSASPSPDPEELPSKAEIERLLKWKASIEADDPATPKVWEPELPETPAVAPCISMNESSADRGRRDLFFLAKDILGYKDMIPRVHQQVCDIYGPVDPGKPLQDQDTVHNYLIIDPRGEFKTSISLAKTIQNWVNFPEAATLRMAGKESLVQGMVQEIKDQILTNTTFRELYREHVPWSEKKGQEGEPPSDFGSAYKMTNPSRKKPRKEATISISTLESAKASTHYEWITGDDLVHETNYQTRELLLKTIEQWDLSRNLLNPRGYRELLGTRYDWSDLYGHIIEKNKGQWRVNCRPIWTEDLDFAKANGFLIPDDYKEGDLIHLHPERWSLQELAQIQDENPFLFNCQRLNNPVPASADNFPMLELVKHTVKREKYPDTGLLNIFMGWRFDFIDPESDPACGVVAGWDSKGRLFVIDCVMGRFKPSQIIDLMVQFWQKWPISRMVLADNKRERMLEAGLMSRLRQLRLSFPIDWVKFGGVDQSEDAMISQVLSLEPLLRENQLWFHSELPHLTNLYLQFSRFPKFKMRSIPYAISRLMHYRTMTQNNAAFAAYGVELYSPSLSWNHEDMELGAGLTG